MREQTCSSPASVLDIPAQHGRWNLVPRWIGEICHPSPLSLQKELQNPMSRAIGRTFGENALVYLLWLVSLGCLRDRILSVILRWEWLFVRGQHLCPTVRSMNDAGLIVEDNFARSVAHTDKRIIADSFEQRSRENCYIEGITRLPL